VNYNDELLKAAFVVDGRDNLPSHDTKVWAYRDPENLLGAVYHQSLEDYGLASGNAKYHVGPNHISKTGLPGLSYTLFVEKTGNAILANNVEDKTYSQGYKDPEGRDENALYIGVCFGGNFDAPGYRGTQIPTSAQILTAELLWHHMAEIWGWRNLDLHGHYHFGKPTCPGNSLTEVISSIRGVYFDTVLERQKALKALGFYKGTIDGMWGPVSKAALVEFQNSVGIEANGVWNEAVSEKARDAMTVGV